MAFDAEGAETAAVPHSKPNQSAEFDLGSYFLKNGLSQDGYEKIKKSIDNGEMTVQNLKECNDKELNEMAKNDLKLNVLQTKAFIRIVKQLTKGAVFKVLVIGDVATGKTSFIQRYVYKTFDEHHHATLGVDFALKRVRIDNTLVNVQLWDIAGQERFIGLAPTYYRHAVGAIVVFDITQVGTLENSKKWKADVDDKVLLRNGDNIPVVLLANKVKLI